MSLTCGVYCSCFLLRRGLGPGIQSSRDGGITSAEKLLVSLLLADVAAHRVACALRCEPAFDVLRLTWRALALGCVRWRDVRAFVTCALTWLALTRGVLRIRGARSDVACAPYTHSSSCS